MQEMTGKSLALQLRLPDAQDGTQRWQTHISWGLFNCDTEWEALQALEKQKAKGKYQWRLVKTYEVIEITE